MFMVKEGIYPSAPIDGARGMDPDSRGACHRARIRATRWLGRDGAILKITAP